MKTIYWMINKKRAEKLAGSLFYWWLVFSASLTAIFYFFPNLFPFLSPIKRTVAGNADF